MLSAEEAVLKQVLYPGPVGVVNPPSYWFHLPNGGVVHALRRGNGVVLAWAGEEANDDVAVFYPAGSSCFCGSRGPVTRGAVVQDAIEAAKLVSGAQGARVAVVFPDADLATDVCYYSAVATLPHAAAQVASDRGKVACIEACGRIGPRKSRHQLLAVDNSMCAELELRQLDELFPVERFVGHKEWFTIQLEENVSSFVAICRCNVSSDKWVVFFHGNGESVPNYCFDSDALKMFRELGWNVCFPEYRGYHPVMASQGQQTCGNIGHDAATVLALIRNEFGAKKLVCYGRSIGSLAAIESTRSGGVVDAIVIESGFSTAGLQRRVKRRLPEWEGPLLSLTETLRDYEGPVLAMHAADDPVVGPENFEENRLARSERAHDMHLLFDFGRHSPVLYNRETVHKALAQFL